MSFYLLVSLDKNLAYKQLVTSSSIYNGAHPPSLVVDGIIEDPPNHCQHFHSALESTNWLRVDLKEYYYIKFVTVHNKLTHDNQKSRLSNTEIYVFGDTPTTNRNLCTTIINGVPDEFFLVCNEVLYGKGVELYQPANGENRILHICELSIYGP